MKIYGRSQRKDSTTGRPGNIDDPIGIIKHRQELVIAEIIHAKMIRMLQMSGRCQNTHNRFLAKNSRQDGYTDIHITLLQTYTEMSVLGHTLLCNIQIGKDLDTGDQRRMNISLDRHIIHDHTIDTHTHLGLLLKRLNMHITGIGLDGTLQKTVEQPDDWCLVTAVFQILDLQIILSTDGGKSHISMMCRFPCTDLRIVIRNGFFQRFLLTQTYLQLTAGLLTDLLQCFIL